MTGTPRVSVITPTRNRLPLLQETMESVRRQAFPAWEHILIDDASTDGTAAWLATLTDPRVRVITLPSQSERSAARNAGAEIAKGEYLYCLDDDDLVVPGALAHLSALLDRDPRSVSASGRTLLFGSGQAPRLLDGPRSPRQGRLLLDALSGAIGLSTGSVLYRASAVSSAGSWDERFVGIEDNELSFRVLALGSAFFSPQVVLKHRIGTSLPSQPEDQLFALFREAQQSALKQMDPAERSRAERVMLGLDELVAAARDSTSVSPVTTWRRELAAIRRDPRYWLGPGRHVPIRIARRALRRAVSRALTRARPSPRSAGPSL